MADLTEEDRAELRQRAQKAAAEQPANDFIRGYRAAWEDVLRVLDAQEMAREWEKGHADG